MIRYFQIMCKQNAYGLVQICNVWLEGRFPNYFVMRCNNQKCVWTFLIRIALSISDKYFCIIILAYNSCMRKCVHSSIFHESLMFNGYRLFILYNTNTLKNGKYLIQYVHNSEFITVHGLNCGSCLFGFSFCLCLFVCFVLFVQNKLCI